MVGVLEVLLDEEDPGEHDGREHVEAVLPQSFSFSDAHAMTIVTEEPIRTKVLNVAIGTFNSPCGHSARRRAA